MTVRVVVVCDHDGCDRQVGAPVNWNCWTLADGRVVSVDGDTEVIAELAEWRDNGSHYSEGPGGAPGRVTSPRRDFCPDHAGDAT